MNGNLMINSWFDLRNSAPISPFELLANAQLDGVNGLFEYADDYMPPPSGTWAATPISILNQPKCAALETDNQQMVAYGDQWNFQHEIANLDSDLAPPLKKMLFLRGGIQWQMHIPLTFATDVDEVLLSYLDNAGTRGDYAGAVPAIRFTGPFATGVHNLVITLKNNGRAIMGLRTIATASGDWAMYESEWIIVP